MGVCSDYGRRIDNYIANSKFPNYKGVDYKSYKFVEVGVRAVIRYPLCPPKRSEGGLSVGMGHECENLERLILIVGDI